MRRSVIEEASSKVQLACSHHWFVEAPKGPVGQGVCRKCGESKEFVNYLEGTSWERDIPVPSLKLEIRDQNEEGLSDS